MSIHKHLPVSSIAEYRALILELTINYLVKQPPDYIDFALDFFIEKKHLRAQPKYSPDYYTVTLNENVADERREFICGGLLEGDESERKGNPLPESVKNRLLKNLKSFFLFENLWIDQMNCIIEVMEIKAVEKGDILIRQGEESHFFYVVEKGFFQAMVENDGKVSVVKTFSDSGNFGGLGLLYSGHSPVTVQATTPGILHVLCRKNFRRAIEEAAGKRRQLIRLGVERLPFLSELDEEECDAMGDNLGERFFHAGERIYGQGDLADGLCLILSGEVSYVQRDSTGKVIEEKTVFAGDSIGTKSTISSLPRLASCTAITDVSIAYLENDKFERLFGPSLKQMKRVIDKYLEKLIEAVDNPNSSKIPENLSLRIKHKYS